MSRRRVPVVLALAASLVAVSPAQAGGTAAQRATAAFKARLGAVYKRRFRHAGRRWALCPRDEVLPFGAICMAEFRYGRRWRLVEGHVNLATMRVKLDYARSWVRRWRRTPASCGRAWGVTGALFDNDHACNGDMASDIERALRTGQSTRWAYVHGTNMAGFGKVGAYRCHRRGMRVTCANSMGDAFRVVG